MADDNDEDFSPTQLPKVDDPTPPLLKRPQVDAPGLSPYIKRPKNIDLNEQLGKFETVRTTDDPNPEVAGAKEAQAHRDKYAQQEQEARDYQNKLRKEAEQQGTLPSTQPHQLTKPDFFGANYRKSLITGSLTYLAIALPLAIAVGSRGSFMAGAAIGGFGKGLTSLVKMNTDMADKEFQEWDKYNQYLYDQDDDILKRQQAILNDKRLSLDTKVKVLNSMNRELGITRQHEAGEESNFQKIMKSLTERSDLHDKHGKVTAQTKKNIASLTADQKNWATIVQGKGGPNPFDPDHPENLDAAQKVYPFAQYMVDKKAGVKPPTESTTSPKPDDDPLNVTGKGEGGKDKDEVESLLPK